MHETQHGATEPVGPFEVRAMPGPGPSHGPGDLSRVSPEIAVKLIGLLDEFERLFGDAPRAWAALEAEIASRKARWESRRAADQPGSADDESPGISRPSPSGRIRREPRPFVGFDREIATYERLKPELLEKGEGRWIVIVGEDVLGPFDEISDAERAGLRRFGEGPMFIKQVLTEEPPPLVLPPYLDIPCQA